MRVPLQTNEADRVSGRAQAVAAAARVADKRAAERRASCSHMWPSQPSLPQAAIGPRQLSQRSLATSVPAYEPSHHNSLSSSSLGSGNGFWQYPHPSDAKLEPEMADLWPRRASETLSSSWLDDYYNSAVADYEDPEEEEDNVFFPRQKQCQQNHTQNNFVQPPPWLPAVFDDAAVNPLLRPIPSRQSRLSYPSSSFHYLAAQQKAAQIMLQNERMLRGKAYPAEQLTMDQYQQHCELQQQQLRQQCADFSSDMASDLYPKEQQLHTVPMPSREEYHQTVTPSAMAAMEAIAALNLADPASRRTALAQTDGNSLFSSTFQFHDPSPISSHDSQQQQQQQQQNLPPALLPIATAPAPIKTFKPMQMVFREGRRASASSTSTSNSSGTGTGPATTATTAATTDTTFSDAMLHQQTTTTAAASARRASSSSSSKYPQFRAPLFSSPSPTSLATLASLDGGTASLPLEEQAFRRQQGISLNYRGDIHNPHNRGDHIPAHINTSLFLMGLPPQATVGDLLRAVAALGPTGRVFAASVNPPDPARRLPLAAAKVSFFTRQQAERLKAQIDAQQLVMFAASHPAVAAARPGMTMAGRPLTIRCAWNRDKKPPRQCVQASECRVLRIRGPVDVVNFEALTAYFDEKFRYELQDVRIVSGSDNDSSTNSSSNRHSVESGFGEQTMEWRFASFQSQAIAAKMALNQERKMVRVEYGRDPCEWGEF